MSAEKILSAFMGLFILVSLILTYFVHPYFVWLVVFIGVNLFQSAFTGICLIMNTLNKLGFKSESDKQT